MRTKIVYGPKGKKLYYIDGKRVSEKKFRAAGNRFRIADFVGSAPGLGQGAATTGWPRKSIAMGVHPSQVAKANEVAKRHGLGVTYDAKDGDMIIPDAAADRRAMKFDGYFNKDSFC